MENLTDKEVKIGVVMTPEEHDDDKISYVTGGGVIAIYLMVMFPVGLIVWALSSRNNWSTELSLLSFGAVLVVFTLIYVFSTMGVLTKTLRMVLRYMTNIYTVKLQHDAYIRYLKTDQENRALEYSRQLMHQQPVSSARPIALLEDKIPLEAQIHAELLKYVTWLYATQDGEYLHINADGRIKNAVPWSARQNKLDPKMVERIIRMVSWKHGKELIYFNKGGWYLNTEDYPYHDEVARMFNQLVVGELNKDEYRTHN